MTWLRALMLLCLVVWLGGIIFFGFVLAPAVFAVLPTHELAGNVVNRTLTKLHFMGLVSGCVFLLFSILYSRIKLARWQLFSGTHVLLAIMLALTAISQFAVIPRMQALRQNMGVIDNVAPSDARRVEFTRLHVWSTQLEGGVFIIGLGVVLLTARRFGN
ncbi:MAG TPA: DUF4149 domain-containing protein [Candidatus Angelobacter sp.]|nr:DUF4149 domain-containing protein [Candidatus Angelobacter sp.]